MFQPRSLSVSATSRWRLAYTSQAARVSWSPPFSASIAAHWTAWKIPESMLVFSWPISPTRSARPHTQPIRQPVMLKVFESEWNSRPISFAPGISNRVSGR